MLLCRGAYLFILNLLCRAMRHVLFVCLVGACGFAACGTKPIGLQAGDLLFQDLNCGDLCNAIEAVTEGKDGRDFSHCAMVVARGDSLAVVEAIGDTVQINSIRAFIARSGDSNVMAMRLRAPQRALVPEASAFALQQIGKAYDADFDIEDDQYYCSELLYKAYKVANGGQDLFPLQAMTFKDPATQSFFPAWTAYYKSLQVAIPEGAPGLNPGGISRSPLLEKIQLN
jgi:hypothetical protein